MKLEVLGCSGGIGEGHRTTAFLVDTDILIDAGTGVGELPVASLARVNHVFVTHSHLDHVASLAWLVDTVGSLRGVPLVVHALPETIRVLKDHIFNWEIWPDFTRIPNAQVPYLRFEPLEAGMTKELQGRKITAIPANHVIPTVGYCIEGAGGRLVFSGDTTINDALWDFVNSKEDVRYLIVETAFSNRDRAIAQASKHLCPSMLAGELSKLRRAPDIYVTHLKPSDADLIMEEIARECAGHRARRLENRQVFDI
jgi:ribonuclease BN (tRNA processing enzyme)